MFALSPGYNQLGESLCAKSRRDVCGANERDNILSPGKGLVLCFCLQGCQEYSKGKWESHMIIVFLFIHT